MKLRFNRAQYRWYDRATEYTYYKLDPPADDTVALFFENGSYREVK